MEIEKPRPSCRASLDYNEAKVLRGVAELAGYANMESPGREAVYALFERYEMTRYPVREKSFHASVNPSAEDACSEEDVLSFIAALMDHLGYGEQPYLVYRHFDIDREHYHVVSVRVDQEGRKINNYYEKRRTSAFMEEVAPRYRFSLAGKGSHVAVRGDIGEGRAVKATRFDPRKGVTEQMKSLFVAALSYDHGSFAQLSAILEDYGLRAALTEGDGPATVILQGLDRKRNPVTEPVSESVLGEPLLGRARLVWDTGRRTHLRRSRERERVRSLVGFAFGISRSEGHFVNILRQKGISVHLARTADSGEVFGITLVDHVTRTVFKGSELRDVISVRAMREAVSSGKWRIEDRGRGRSTYVRSAREVARADALALRDLQAGAIARVLRGDGRPGGACGGGRTPPDRERIRARQDEERGGALDASFEDRRYEEKLR